MLRGYFWTGMRSTTTFSLSLSLSFTLQRFHVISIFRKLERFAVVVVVVAAAGASF